MATKVGLIANLSFIFAMLLATTGDAQYSHMPCTAAPSPLYNLKPCEDKLTIPCPDEIFAALS